MKEEKKKDDSLEDILNDLDETKRMKMQQKAENYDSTPKKYMSTSKALIDKTYQDDEEWLGASHS